MRKLQQPKTLPCGEQTACFIKQVSNEITSIEGIPYFVWLTKATVFPDSDIPVISLYLENDDIEVFEVHFYITIEENPRLLLLLDQTEAPDDELKHIIQIVHQKKNKWIEIALKDPYYIQMPEIFKHELVEV